VKAKRILVIDDEDMIRQLVKEMLEVEGYIVTTAANGKEGLQLYQRELPDLIITDIFMPEMEGLETIRTLQRDSSKVKIIAISGGGERGMISFLSHAKRFGALRTLQKPFSRQDLLTSVGEVLGED
jgi:two-component system, chemotaxis family, chemotaxis protein CheY